MLTSTVFFKNVNLRIKVLFFRASPLALLRSVCLLRFRSRAHGSDKLCFCQIDVREQRSTREMDKKRTTGGGGEGEGEGNQPQGEEGKKTNGKRGGGKKTTTSGEGGVSMHDQPVICRQLFGEYRACIGVHVHIIGIPPPRPAALASPARRRHHSVLQHRRRSTCTPVPFSPTVCRPTIQKRVRRNRGPQAPRIYPPTDFTICPGRDGFVC